MMRAWLFIFALFFSCGFTQPQEKLADPALEARAVAIGNELRCVVCEGQSVEDSNAAQAKDVRLLVRDMITAGKTDDEIFTYMRDRYGDRIMMTPPFDAATALLWLAPLVIIGIAGIGAWFSFRKKARRF